MFMQLFCFSVVAQKYNREKFKEFVNTLAGIKTDEVRYNFNSQYSYLFCTKLSSNLSSGCREEASNVILLFCY